jgi:putative SOS response-associated peptidase YedK
MIQKFSFDISKEKIRKQFNINFKQEFIKSFHISALQHAYVLTSESNELQLFKWGLIPYWATEPDKVEHLVCAQAEGIASKDSFRMPIRQKRAIVFADSYYDYKRVNKKDQFYRIQAKNQAVLAFAVIWDEWKSPAGKVYFSFSMITIPAYNELKEQGWNRIPLVFTEEEQIRDWIDKESSLEKILAMFDSNETILHAYPVSNELLNSGKDSPELHNEIQLDKY